VKRHSSTSTDVEGRPVTGALTTVATVTGHIFTRTITATADGRIVLGSQVKALLPAGTDVRVTDVLEVPDRPGVVYRVQTVVERPSPFGGTHHVSVDCEVSN
jgi:hypothetical protein